MESLAPSSSVLHASAPKIETLGGSCGARRRGGGELLPLSASQASAGRPQALGKQGGEKPSSALTFLHLFSLPGWFAWTLWSLLSVSAHSRLLTVDREGGLPATDAATGEQLSATEDFLCVTQSWLPAQALPKGQGSVVWVGWRERKEEGRREGGSAW